MAVAYPFISTEIDPSGLALPAQRAPGVVAIVGDSDGPAAVDDPIEVGTVEQIAAEFGADSRLAGSLRIAMAQAPRASRFYGVRAGGGPPDADDYTSALNAVAALDDVTLVALADEPIDVAAADAATATELVAPLMTHVETASDEGNKRLGVAMIRPGQRLDLDQWVDRAAPLKSAKGRLVLVGAHAAHIGGDPATAADMAAAAAGAIAGRAPHISLVLKPLGGLLIPRAMQFTPTEITRLSEENVNPVIDPTAVRGEGLRFAEGRTFTTETENLYIDVVRVLDDVEFRLKAGLIGTIGDARITKDGLSAIKTRAEAILGLLVRAKVLDGAEVQIEVLDALFIPPAARNPVDEALITTARGERSVDMRVTVVYGPATHHLRMLIAPTF